MRNDLIRLWLTVAFGIVLAIATVSYYSNPPSSVEAAQTPGEILFLTKGCTGCHSIQASPRQAKLDPI